MVLCTEHAKTRTRRCPHLTVKHVRHSSMKNVLVASFVAVAFLTACAVGFEGPLAPVEDSNAAATAFHGSQVFFRFCLS